MRFIRLVLVAALLAVASCADSARGGGTASLQPVQADRKPPQMAGSIGPTLRGAAPVIAAAGDISCDTLIPGETTCHHGATSDLLVEGGYDRVLALGDSQYEDGAFGDFRAYFHPTWGRVKRQIRPAAGNHEYQTPGARGYFRYFRGAAGPRGKGYYSFDIGSWHIVALNSNCGEVSCAAGSEQEQWLRADLAEHDNTCTLAYWHHPRWSSGTVHGGIDDVAPFIEALYDLGADVVLVGHEHNYERFAPQNPDGEEDTARGIREFVAGTGGKDHHPFGTPEPNSQVRNSDTHGVLRLTLHPASYEWEFMPEEGGTFTDSGQTDCH